MAGESLPYLDNISITPTLPCVGDKVPVKITWTVGLARPSVVEVYLSISQETLLDRNNLVWTYQPDQAPLTLTFTRPNHDPVLYIGIAPRMVENGQLTDDLPDASGEPKTWDNLVTAQGMSIVYTAPPQQKLPPPLVQVASIVKTLSAPDHLDVTVIASNADNFNLIVNTGGQDEAQRSSKDGFFPSIPSTPGQRYLLRAQQHNKGSGNIPATWSPFSNPTPITANPRVRSLRSFLVISDVLKPGTPVRQFTATTNSSVRTMMGI